MQTVLDGTELDVSEDTQTTVISEIPLSQRSIVYPIAVASIAAMSDRLKPLVISGIDDKPGALAVHKGRMECVRTRGLIEKKRKELKADSVEYGKKVDSVAKTLTESVLEIERDLITKEEAIEKERERIAKAEADAIYAGRLKQITDAGVQDDRQLNETSVRSMTEICFTVTLQAAIETARVKREQQEEDARAEARRKQIAAEEGERIRAERARLDEERAEFDRQQAEKNAETERRNTTERQRLEVERHELAREITRVRLEREKVEAEQRQQQEAFRKEMAKQAANEREQREAVEREERERLETADREAAELAAQQRAEELRPARDKIERFAILLESLSLPDVPQEPRMKLAGIIDAAAAAVRQIASVLV